MLISVERTITVTAINANRSMALLATMILPHPNGIHRLALDMLEVLVVVTVGPETG